LCNKLSRRAHASTRHLAINRVSERGLAVSHRAVSSELRKVGPIDENMRFTGLFVDFGRSPALYLFPRRHAPAPTDSPSRSEAHVGFQVGDKVIYPNHGLGVVQKIEEKTILGTTCGFFHLRILSNETTVLVPVANVDNVGLRRAITDEEVERLFHLIGDGKIDNHANWKGRFKDNSDKMRTGSIYDMADVLKSLTFLSKSKSLSFREKRMLDRAKSLIVSEVSEVMRVTTATVEDRVEKALERCFMMKARAQQRAATRPTPKAMPAKAMATSTRAAAARRQARAS
jgi:CarD family transcriptional regulator